MTDAEYEKQSRDFVDIYEHVLKLIRVKYNTVYGIYLDYGKNYYDEALKLLESRDKEISAYMSAVNFMCRKAYSLDWSDNASQLARIRQDEREKVLNMLKKRCEVKNEIQ